MADMRPFDFLCRICASDTKGKNSVAECVFVLKTAALKEKIQKYLDLTVSEGDALPKVICKSCYRSVEGIVSLSKIAIHTQMVLSNFLKPHAALIEPDAEYSSFAISCKDYDRSSGGNSIKGPTPTNHQPPAHAKPKHAEEVVVNVSVADPLTRETQQKIMGAARQRQNTMDARFIPKSIAHRHVSFAANTPKEIGSLEPTNLSISKNSTPTGVINYFNPQQQQQQVTVTSGGYIIGQVDSPPKSLHKSPATQPTAAPISVPLPQPPPPPSILSASSGNKSRTSSENDQKRNNLKMTLKNIRAANMINSGQVSLLKVSQKHNPVQQQQNSNSTKSPPSMRAHLLSTSRSDIPEEVLQRGRALSPTIGRKSRRPPPQRRPTIAEIPSSVEALPKEIIIASVKKPKHAHSSERHSRSSADDGETEIPKSLFPDDIALGRVIKDFDLLKLIMKALKWPVNKDNMEAQMTRLRNSKFTTIMSDPNLLQDTDLTQLLGPYLAPVLLAAQVLQQQQQQQQKQQQQQQQQHQQMTASMSGDIPTDLSSNTATNLASAIPYRLPPETSVQLVPASPEEEPQVKSPPHSSRKSAISNKKIRRPAEPLRQRDNSIVISDGEEELATTSGNIRRKVDDKSLLRPESPHDGQRSSLDLSFDSSLDIGKQLNERNRGGFDRARSNASQRKHTNLHQKLSGSIPTLYPSFVDDIVLIEPEQLKETNMLSPLKDSPRKRSTSSLLAGISLSSPSNPFTARVVPPITRPIIKHRKTVIHASPSKTTMVSHQSLEQIPGNTTSIKERIPKETPLNQASSTDSMMSAISLTELEAPIAAEKLKLSLAQSATEIITPTTPTAIPSTIALTTTKSVLKPVASQNVATAANTTTKTVLKTISPTVAPPITSISQPAIAAIKSTTTTTTITPPKILPTTQADLQVAAITPAVSASTVQTSSPLSSSTTTDLSNDNKKVSVSTSMSFFGVVATQTSNTATLEKEVPPKKSTLGSKAALAEQLLEAVGLKKSNSATSEKSTSNESFANSRESVQQIRSALKRSLKQAVEQNLRKLEEQPVIKQVADSTTKSIIKDLNIESKMKQQQSSTSKPSTSGTDIKDEIDKEASVDEKSEKPISILKSRSAPTSEADKDNILHLQEETKQRIPGRQSRKNSTLTSVIKKSVSTAVKHDDETKANIETKASTDRSGLSASLSETLNSGNTVSSTSENLQSHEAAQSSRKRGRKRKVEEETGGDGVENLELDVKKDMKVELEAEAVGIGDNESLKETSHVEEGDKKLDAGGSRPSRVSKTLSKYYKGPGRQASMRSTRSTRNKQ